MAFNTQIYNSEEGLLAIYKGVSDFNPDVFIYAVTYGKVDEEKLNMMIDHIVDYKHRLEKEYASLISFGNIFNTLYATEDNKRFECADRLLNRMKCGIKLTKDLFVLFKPKQSRFTKRCYDFYGIEQPSIWNNSYITSTTYSKDMFKFEGYSACVHGCYVEMCKFFELLQLCIRYCQKVLLEEKTIRQDTRYCTYLYKCQRDKLMKDVTDLLVGINELNKEIFDTNPLLLGRKKYGNSETNIRMNFHNCSTKDMRLELLYDLYKGNKDRNYPPHVLKLFNSDFEMIAKVYNVVENFDMFVNNKKPGHYIGSEIIALFVMWCKTDDVKNTVNFFNEIYKGDYKCVKPQAVYEYYKKLKLSMEKNIIPAEYKEFEQNVIKCTQPVLLPLNQQAI